ncbi:thiopeptide maturation pyridine synthase [Actinomadura oligospora]|uniref:thiopeptide maturation pyridine synthase n=1 Tax=Actinomadura oligospora TaxID=111804 RepID=UPI00047CCEE8|nr:thiopeptide maturation pyridine synthase [Actinomadura oligospora]
MTATPATEPHPTEQQPAEPQPTAADAEQWHAAHIYYYERDKTALLLDAVRPLIHDLRAAAPDAYVLRHWRQGPHLRLNIRTDPRTWTTTVQPAIERTIGDYLAAHPSTARPDRLAALAQHRFLAQREEERGPLTPWFPDNSIQYVPFDDRRHVLNDPESVELLTDFYVDGTPLLFDALEHVRSGHDGAEAVGLGLMLATSITALPPITSSFVSYRSHAEGFIAQCADPDATRARFDAHYRAHRARLTERVRAVEATLDGDTDVPVPFVAEWADLIATFCDRATPLIAQGKLIQPPAYDADKSAQWPSEFHRMMFGNRAYHRAAFENPAFSRYRLLINYTYLHINRLGLTPPERFRLCHLAANAVEDVHRLDAVDLVRRFTLAHPNED